MGRSFTQKKYKEKTTGLIDFVKHSKTIKGSDSKHEKAYKKFMYCLILFLIAI